MCPLLCAVCPRGPRARSQKRRAFGRRQGQAQAPTDRAGAGGGGGGRTSGLRCRMCAMWGLSPPDIQTSREPDEGARAGVADHAIERTQLEKSRNAGASPSVKKTRTQSSQTPHTCKNEPLPQVLILASAREAQLFMPTSMLRGCGGWGRRTSAPCEPSSPGRPPGAGSCCAAPSQELQRGQQRRAPGVTS